MESNKKKELWRVVKFTLFSASAGLIEITEDGVIDRLCSYDEYMHLSELEQNH